MNDRSTGAGERDDEHGDVAQPDELLIVPMSDGPALRIRDRHVSDGREQRDGADGVAPGAESSTGGDHTPTMIVRPDSTGSPRQQGVAGPDRPPVRKRWRILQVLVVVVLALAAYYGITLWQVASVGRSDQARPVDAIVVMGAAQYDGRPSPQLAARLDHVVTLWPQGLAPVVVVTGGNQPGDRFTEAGASADYLIERGVPAEAILLEDVGATSYDSLARVADLLAARTGRSDAAVLVVTDPYHALRSRMIAAEVGLSASVSPTPTSVVTGTRSLERHLVEAGGVAVGRVTGFAWLDRVTD